MRDLRPCGEHMSLPCCTTNSNWMQVPHNHYCLELNCTTAQRTSHSEAADAALPRTCSRGLTCPIHDFEGADKAEGSPGGVQPPQETADEMFAPLPQDPLMPTLTLLTLGAM